MSNPICIECLSNEVEFIKRGASDLRSTDDDYWLCLECKLEFTDEDVEDYLDSIREEKE